jgi:hypothetical protein
MPGHAPQPLQKLRLELGAGEAIDARIVPIRRRQARLFFQLHARRQNGELERVVHQHFVRQIWEIEIIHFSLRCEKVKRSFHTKNLTIIAY